MSHCMASAVLNRHVRFLPNDASFKSLIQLLRTLARATGLERDLSDSQFAKWQAFRRFLTDFSHLKDAPPPAIAVWEHYIPYAVTLGVAQEVLRQIPVVYEGQLVSSPA